MLNLGDHGGKSIYVLLVVGMALFGTPNSFVGLDVGTASLKAVELVNRHRRVEVATYGQADLTNPLLVPSPDDTAGVQLVADVISRLFEQAGVSADAVVVALPSSIVFSTVLELPHLPEDDMDRAVRAAAQDVVPADLRDTVLGWSRVGTVPHMEGQQSSAAPTAAAVASSDERVPVFITAAPRDVVDRYTRVLQLAKLELIALEVETFPLVRSLLSGGTDSAMIVDLGAEVTTYHIVDGGVPRVSHAVDHGGAQLTQAAADALQISVEEAEQQKITHGLVSGSDELTNALRTNLEELLRQARQLLDVYRRQSQRTITKTILIGSGANLQGLPDAWSTAVQHPASVGNPWRGLSYPEALERRAQELAPTFAVAVGLAERGLIPPRS